MGPARSGADDRLLEMVALDGRSLTPPGAGPLTASSRGRRRRAPWIVVASLIIGAAVVLPARAHASRAEAARVEQRWLSARSVVDDRDTITARLHAAATADDATSVDDAETALDAEAVSALDRIRHELDSMLVLDGGVRRARGAVNAWIERVSIDRREHLTDPPGSTERAFVTAANALTAAQARWRMPPTLPHAPVRLHAADATLAALGRYVDSLTGARLVATDRLGFSVVDVDANRNTAAQPTGVDLGTRATAPVVLVPRTGYLAFVTARTAWAMPAEVDGAAQLLGQAGDVLPSVRPDAVWLVDAPVRGLLTAREVDGHGATIDGPYSFVSRPVAAVRGGLLVASNNGAGLAVVDPATSRVERTITDDGARVAGSLDQVAWLATADPAPARRLHLTSLTDGTDVVVDSPSAAKWLGPGAFSPDGRMLAAAFFDGTTQPGRFRLAVLDVASRRMQAIDGLVGEGAPQSIAWSADGTRVFVSSDADHSLATYRLGDPRVTQLRLTGVRAGQLVVLPAATS